MNEIRSSDQCTAQHPPLAIQEAMYYRAECLRLQGYVPKAADVYVALMNKFPGTSYREQCCQHVYDIANQWLDETRAGKFPWNAADPSRNFFTPAAFATAVQAAFDEADRYVWIYAQDPRWWGPSGPRDLPAVYDSVLRSVRR